MVNKIHNSVSLSLRGIRLITSIAMLLALMSCAKKAEVTDEAKQVEAQSEIPTNAVSVPTNAIASVNGQYITLEQVDVIKQRTLGKRPNIKPSAELDAKITESAIMSRAMAVLALQEINDKKKTEIERWVEAYREELLVKEYLHKHSVARPITQEMIEAYYKNNPEYFGAVTTKKMEMLKVHVARGEAALWTKRLGEIIDKEDWLGAIKELGGKGDSIEHKQFRHRKGLMGDELDRIIKSLSTGDKSTLHLVNHSFYVFKVLDQTVSAAKPLSQVVDQVRKHLMPGVVAQAVGQATEALAEKVEIKRY